MENCTYAFNNPALSDRLLQLVVKDPNVNNMRKRKTAEPASQTLHVTPQSGGSGKKQKMDEFKGRSKEDAKSLEESSAEEKDLKFHVSTLLLCMKSEYFRAMFGKTEWKEQKEKEIEVEVTSEEVVPFRHLLYFIYSNTFDTSNVETEDLFHIILLADRLAVPTAITAICQEIRSKIPFSISLCNRTFELPESVLENEGIKKFVDAASNFLISRFSEFENMWSTPEFLSLSSKSLAVIFKSDDLLVRSENTVWHAFDQWFMNLVEQEQAHCWIEYSDLLQHIRFPLMTPCYLQQIIASNGDCFDYPEWRERATQALSYSALSERMKKMVRDKYPKMYQHRRSFNSHPARIDVLFQLDPNPKDNPIIYSDTTYVDGYAVYIRITVGKIRPHEDDEPDSDSKSGETKVLDKKSKKDKHQDALAVYCFLDSRKGPLANPVVELQVSFLAKNYLTGKWDEMLDLESDIYTKEHGFGVDNLFEVAWEDIFQNSFEYLNHSTKTMAIRAVIRLCEKPILPRESVTF